MPHKNTSIFFIIFILSSIILVGTGAWGADVLGFFFEADTKKYILIISGCISVVAFILYLSDEIKSKRSLKKLGNNYYTQSAADFIKNKDISPETIDNIIKVRTVIKRSDSHKYTWTNSEGIKYIIITDTKGVVSEVVS